MSLEDITRQSVLEAIREFDRIGRKNFLRNYGFDPAEEQWLIHDGRRYDPIAIIGVAHQYARPDLGLLNNDNFPGEAIDVQDRLEELRFIVWVDRGEIGGIALPGEVDIKPFDADGMQNARNRISRRIACRRGHHQFRSDLLAAYDYRCAISGCDIVELLEAAHIRPHRGPHTNEVHNGILLRADLHTLFDLGLIAIDHNNLNLTVLVHDSVRRNGYEQFHNKNLNIPLDPENMPSSLRHHFHRSHLGPIQ